MHIFFVPLYDFFKSRKPLFWLVFLLSFALWGWLAARVELKEDISSMLPESKSVRAMNEVIGNTSAGEQLIFLVSFTDTEYHDNDSLVSAASDFTRSFSEKFSSYIDTVILQPGAGFEERMVSVVQENLPLFLEQQDYHKIDSLIQQDQVANTLAANKRILLSPAGVYYKKLVAADPVGISNIVWNKLQQLQYDESYDTYDGYLIHKETGKLTFFLKPAYSSGATGMNSAFFSNADEFIGQWEQDNGGVNITYFGAAAVAAGNADQMRTDTIVTLTVTIVLLLLLTFYFFRRKRIPLLLLVPVLYGGAMGVGVLSLVQGSISVIALGAGAIIMGIAIDFSIHFLSHARKSESIRETVKELSQPLTLGSFTTVAAFLSLRLVSTPILQDLGLFAAASLTGAALCTLIFLPHLPLGKASREQAKPTLFDNIAKWRPERNKWLVGFIFLLTPVLLYFSGDVQFDSNLMNLNYMSPELQKAQDEVSEVNTAAISSVYVIAQDTIEDNALNKLEGLNTAISDLENKGWVRGVSNPTLLLPSNTEQEKRLQQWNSYWTNEKREAVMKMVAEEGTKIGFSAKAFTRFENTLSNKYDVFDSTTRTFIKTLYPTGFAKNDQQYAITSLRVLPEHRKHVFDALSEYDEVAVTDRQQGATQLIDILNTDFTDIAVYSSFIVFFALLIGYGRIELAIISFLPMAISWIWILGLMSLLGLKFNIVNIIISSLIFGLGDDYAIFTMDGLVERFRTGKQKLSSVRAAVYVSALTVVIGLGVLLLAKHPALRSIAFISVTGLVCVLFISQTLQPFLFNWFIQRRADKKFLPFTLSSFLMSLYAFTLFFIGSMLLTILGVVFTKLWPFGKDRGKYLYHICISKLSKDIIYLMFNYRKRIYNISEEQFNEPAVFVANHTSFLDILYIQMLSPKLILLTNRWVWRSPVFGAIVRMAEYYPVADGAEDSIEPLRELVQRGYSIAVFPEGTRSMDDKVKRYHKGAFYIAEQLNLDVAPLVFHGAHHGIQKGDWMLKSNPNSLYIYPRIKPDDTNYGEGYAQRAKHIGRWTRKELNNIKEQKETPSFFRQKLLRSYTYKGPVLEWYCRIKTGLEDNYEAFHELLPREGQMYDLGCGYGFMTYMLHWAAPGREFVGIDYDEDKIETAQNNFVKDDGINFQQGDLTALTLQPCDAVIISDVLHYLLPKQQETLLENCYKALNDGGRIIIRDGISELTDRIKGTKLTELFSTKILKFNKTQNTLHFISRKLLDDFAARHNMKVTVIDNAKRTANLTFVLEK